MSNFIHTLSIENFKSIRSLRLDCKRINVFVGAPNVGKSNILEALALMGLTKPHIASGVRDLVRFETMDNLFYDNRKNEICSVTANEFMYQLRYDATRDKYLCLIGDTERMKNALAQLEKNLANGTKSDTIETVFHQELSRTIDLYKGTPLLVPAYTSFDRSSNPYVPQDYPSRIRKYIFSSQTRFDETFNDYLLPVFGKNLFSVLEKNQDLMSLVAPLTEPYKLKIYWDDEKYYLAKVIGSTLRKYPFSLIADTLQRVIFYLAAIHTNTDSVLIFEEPETHLHAMYAQQIASSMVESTQNQFFFTTHSPYLLQHLMEHTPAADIGVFAVSFDTKEYATKARLLPFTEIEEIVSYGTDVFFNMERYDGSKAHQNGHSEVHDAEMHNAELAEVVLETAPDEALQEA
jgi:hypothetical protein